MGNQTSCNDINDNNNIIISIDGNIGSGKSTLLKNLKEFYKDNKKIIFLKEPVDEWNEIKDMRAGTVKRKIIDDTMLGGPRERTIVYEAPFDRCDREKDYEIAWAEFERRFKEKEASN